MEIDDGGSPRTGRSAKLLGVRTDGPNRDIDVDAARNVLANGKGMSVCPAPQHLPYHLVRKELSHIVEGASASNAKPLRIWRSGSGPFVTERIGQDLKLNIDSATHGTVGLAAQVLLESFEAALYATQPSWTVDESGIVE